MDYRQTYRSGAVEYQQLVAAEDADGNLGPALGALLEGLSSVVEIGAGTGRVTRLLRRLGLDVVATEPSANMLGQAVRLDEADGTVHFCQAEAAHLPLRSGSFDGAIAGWVFGHQREWRPSDWRETIAGFLDECDRVTSGGTVVIIETLGTGHETPSPTPELAEYYSWLEQVMGFDRQWVRTDYLFPTVETAAEVTGSFFGPQFAELVREHAWARVPECTGIWVRPSDATASR